MATRSKLLQSAVCLAVAQSFASGALQDFGQVAIGSSHSATLTYSFTGLSAAPTFSLSGNRDFQAGLPACTVVATTNCTVAITFTPVRPGVRLDALTATNQSGAVLMSTSLRGVGQSPLIALYPGIISTLSGNGTWGYEDSPNPAMAMFRNPQGISLDGSGNFAYVADSVNNMIRKVTLASGAVITVAGTGSSGFGGDGGPAPECYFEHAHWHRSGWCRKNSYIADQGNNLIRRVRRIHPTDSHCGRRWHHANRNGQVG